jgi:hypothetical protein
MRLDAESYDIPEIYGLQEYEREQYKAKLKEAKAMGFPSVEAYESAFSEPPTDAEIALHQEDLVENPYTHEIVNTRTGEVIEMSTESPTESLTQTLKAVRGFTKGGEAERLELGTILTPRQQIQLNRALGLQSHFVNAPNIRRTRRTKGLKKESEMSNVEKIQLEKMQAPTVPEAARRALTPKQQERRRLLMLQSMKRNAIERAEEGASNP